MNILCMKYKITKYFYSQHQISTYIHSNSFIQGIYIEMVLASSFHLFEGLEKP